MLAFIDSPIQLIIAAVVILIVFGPQKLPEIMGQLGRGLRDLKKAGSEFSRSINLEDDPLPKYDAYNSDYSYTTTETAAIPEESTPVLAGHTPDNGWYAASAPEREVRGDFAASALSDTGEGYGVLPSPAPAEPAKPELTVSPPQGATISRESSR